jgi:hypothetical protein
MPICSASAWDVSLLLSSLGAEYPFPKPIVPLKSTFSRPSILHHIVSLTQNSKGRIAVIGHTVPHSNLAEGIAGMPCFLVIPRHLSPPPPPVRHIAKVSPCPFHLMFSKQQFLLPTVSACSCPKPMDSVNYKNINSGQLAVKAVRTFS